MVREATPIGISAMPDVVRLAEEVARTGTARVLPRAGEGLAVIGPVPATRQRRRKRATQADIDATLSVFGAWKDKIDPEAFKRQVKEGREDDRPSVRR